MSSMIEAIMQWFIDKLSSIASNTYVPKIVIFIVSVIILRKIYKARQASKINAAPFKPRVLIIGSGMSGINAAVNLKTKLNLDNFAIYERNADVGGTWFSNTYPGCACDLPGMNYSLSHDVPKHWVPNYYATYAETHEYMQDICKKYDLYKHIQFNSTVTKMVYDNQQKIWNVTVSDNQTNQKQTVQANIVISGVGILAEKMIPKFKNAAKYKGHSFHSSEWDHSYDFTNKNVAVIGTGPTAIQVVPSLGQTKCNKLYVFQRSISHLVPKLEATKNTRRFWSAVFTCLPFAQTISRCYQYLWCEFLFYPALKVGSKYADVFEVAAKQYRQHVFGGDSQLMAATEPKTIFGKRVLLSSNYFQTYNQENCEVITDGIEQFTENGIMVRNGNGETEELKVDCIVYCTGFRTQEFLCSIKDGVFGKDGRCLQNDVWEKNNCFAYLGIITSGFPNLFMLYGPGTNLVHNSVLFQIECAMGYSVQCMRRMMLNGYEEIDVKEEAMKAFVAKLDKENERNAWMDSKITNWYKNNKGRGSTNWAWGCNYYWWVTRSVQWGNFDFK